MKLIELPADFATPFTSNAPERWLEIAVLYERRQGENSDPVMSSIKLVAARDGEDIRTTSLDVPAKDSYLAGRALCDLLPSDWSEFIMTINRTGQIRAHYSDEPFKAIDYVSDHPFHDYFKDKRDHLIELERRTRHRVAESCSSVIRRRDG